MADFAPFMREVAIRLLGEPNSHLSNKNELRFGSHGSLSVDLKAGVFRDHETETGGGVLALIARETGKANGEAVQWLRDEGFHVEDDRPQQQPRAQKAAPPKGRRQAEATYDYVDEQGELLFQAVRFIYVDERGAPVMSKDGKVEKTFGQRRRATDGDRADEGAKIYDGWVWNIRGCRHVPYRLPEVLEAISLERPIYIVEGEKKADALWKLGIAATCNAMGAGKWPEALTEFFKGADIVILPDNDEAGRKHRDLVGAMLQPVALSVRVLELPALPPKGDVVDWLVGGGTAEELVELADSHAVTWAPGGGGLHFGAVWFSDVDRAIEGPRWLIDDLLTRGDKSLVYGERSSGKSFLASHLAMGVATGRPIFETYKTEQGGVVYIAGEGKQGYRQRLKAYRQHFAISSNVPFVLIPTAIDLFGNNDDVKTLVDDLRMIDATMQQKFGCRLVLTVIDTLWASSPGANENAGEDMSKIIKNGERLQEVSGSHLMLVHHKNAGGERPRGHTSLLGAVDNAIEVSVDEHKNRTARIAKQKDAEDGGQIAFRLQSVQLGSRDDGKPITSCVVVPAQDYVERTSSNSKGPALSNQLRIAFSTLTEALLSSGEPAPPSFGLPASVRKVVNVKHWKREYIARAFAEEPSDEAFRKAFQRVGEGLVARGLIGRRSPFVWIAREP